MVRSQSAAVGHAIGCVGIAGVPLSRERFGRGELCFTVRALGGRRSGSGGQQVRPTYQAP